MLYAIFPLSTTDASFLSFIQVAKHKEPRDACAAIVAESYRRWLQYETRTDDITVIVVHVNGLNDVSMDFTALCCATFIVILMFLFSSLLFFLNSY